MSTITLPTATGPVSVATHAVYTRTAWAAAWTLQADLWCQRVTRATGETLSAAEFRWRFGQHLAPGSAVWAAKPVVSIDPLSYVQVIVAGSGGRAGFAWWGVWRSAVMQDVEQVFTAVGLEQVLDQPCRDAPWLDGGVAWVGAGLTFNDGGKPNRSANKYAVNGQNVYVFSDDELTAQPWSTRDCVETLLAMAAPKDATGTVVWNWVPANLAALPDFDAPQLATDGVSFLQLLRSLVSRYLLTCWIVEPNGTAVQVRFDTFAETAINLEDVAGDPVGTIPANSAQDALVVADQSSRVSLSTEAAHVADQVVVSGAGRKQVFTLQKGDDAWAKLWTADLQSEYDEGAENAADYPPADDVDLRENRDRAARNSERLRSVYSHFGPTADWDQVVVDELAEEPYYLGEDDDDAEVQVVLYPPLLEFAERLPLRAGYRYDGSRITDREDDPGHHGESVADVPHEDLPVLGWARVVKAADDPDDTDRWQAIDQLARTADLEQVDEHAARRWSGEVRSLRGKLGVEIRIQGEQQHAIAKAENIGTTLEVFGAVDWGYTEQEILVTVCVEDPRRVEVRWPADADVAAVGELVRRLRIEDDQYQLIHVIPGTVVETDPETLELRRTDGGMLQDDRDEMLLLAQRTYSWHSVPRYALRLATGLVDGAVQIGHLITQIALPSGAYPVRSVVTEITVDFPIGSGGTPQRPTMSVATAFGEMDARRF
jgi:hypothetical protein